MLANINGNTRRCMITHTFALLAAAMNRDRSNVSWRKCIATCVVILSASTLASAQVVDANGQLDAEALLALDVDGNGIRDIFEVHPQFAGKGVAFFRLDGERPNDVDGATGGTDSAGPDGFRDGGLSFFAVPDCESCRDLDPFFVSAARSPMNTGKLTIIYLADSSGNPYDSDGDNSLLYVGMDIFNGSPYPPNNVLGDPGGLENVNWHTLDFVDTLQFANICEDGVADYDGNLVPDMFGVPFDVDGDGDPIAITRWEQDGDPNCDALLDPGADNDFEVYRLWLYVCPPDDFQSDRAQLGFVRIATDFNEFNVALTKSSAFNVAGVQFETFPQEGTDIRTLGVSDVEFVIRGVDTLIDAQYPTDYQIDRLRIANGGVQTRSDSNADSSAEDKLSGAWFLPVPLIEVTKEIRCVETGEPNAPNEWRETAEALPGSVVEFKIEVENTGNIPLAVTLDDVLEAFGSASFAVDPAFLDATLYRPSDGTGTPIDPSNAGGFGLNPEFFIPGGPASPGFLGGVAADPPEARYLGVLNAIDVCTDPNNPILGDRMVLVFRATVDAPPGCDGELDVDIRNSITAIGDPDVPPVSDGDEVFDNPDVIDTYREEFVNSPPADDNVVTANVLCREVTFAKKIGLCPDCNDPNTCGPFVEELTISPDATYPLCIGFRYTITNDGEVDEQVTLSDAFLCADVDAVGGTINFCDVCPDPAVFAVASGMQATKYCLVELTEQQLLDLRLIDDGTSRPCPIDDPPGVDDPNCYSNCAALTANATNLGSVCDSAPEIELRDHATVCLACTGRIGDFVWDDGNELDCNGCQEVGEEGIADVTVILKDAGGVVIDTQVTDANGYYEFTGLCRGDYTVEVDESTLPPDRTWFAAPCMNPGCEDPAEAHDNNCSPAAVTLPFDDSEDLTIDFGYCALCTGRIGDFVWDDGNEEDCNGCQEVGEEGIADVTVILKDAGGVVIDITMTDANGYYEFTGLCGGDYTVEVDESTLPPDRIWFPAPCMSPECEDPAEANDNNCSPAAVTLPFDDSEDLTIDFGYCTPCTGRIGDFVWNDGNELDCNGCQEVGEEGIADVTVILKDAGGVVIDITMTDANGYYEFTGLCGGDYTVEVDEGTLPPGFFPSPCMVPDCEDPAEANDNNCSPAAVTLPFDNSEDLTIDFGYCTPSPCELSVVISCEVIETPPGGEGCTPGYWKNHLSAWPAPYQPEDGFDATFGVDAFDPDITLDEAVNLGGGDVDALARHAVAALLNAAHENVGYALTEAEVIALVQAALAPGGDVEGTKNQLEGHNEEGCPLNGGGDDGEGDRSDSWECCYPPGGADVEYSYLVTNTGSVVVTDITVVDDVFGVVPGSPIASLDPGQSVTLMLTQFIATETTNTVAVAGESATGPCEATDSIAVGPCEEACVLDVTIVCMPSGGGEGCTPGYWKNHLDMWPEPYQADDDFDATFGVDAFDPDITLEAAVNLGGGGVNALARHAVAALLNAAHENVGYALTEAEVIALVQAALAPGGDVEGTKNQLEGYNEEGCPLDSDGEYDDVASGECCVPPGGADIEFAYMVTNTGLVAATNVNVTDSFGEVPGSPIDSLEPNETVTLTRTQFLTEETTNTVVVTGEAPGSTCEATDSLTIPLCVEQKECAGDLNGDGVVDLHDVAELIGHYGTTGGATYEDGDLDGDGDVDLDDLGDMLGLYGTRCG